MDFIVFLNKNLKQPLYFQLYSYIKKEIEAGSLVAGVKMPPIRQLAIHLRVSKTTIETAYQQLVAEGYLESRAKSGIWVSPQEEIGLATQSIKHEDDFSVVNEATVRYNFEYGDIAVESFPIKKWKRSINEALSTGRADLLLYGERQGSLALREELAKYLNQSRGISCSPGQIVITAGTQPAISTLCQ
ncbi:aminotransferase class I/II-fold pyridoxal phosphate-dependent enzyme, partial [Bacillus canaveralius]